MECQCASIMVAFFNALLPQGEFSTDRKKPRKVHSFKRPPKMCNSGHFLNLKEVNVRKVESISREDLSKQRLFFTYIKILTKQLQQTEKKILIMGGSWHNRYGSCLTPSGPQFDSCRFRSFIQEIFPRKTVLIKNCRCCQVNRELCCLVQWTAEA